MQVVICDTNVLLDLFVFNDFRALHLKQALLEGKMAVLATPNTLAEFSDVIARPLFALDQAKQAQIYLEWQQLAKVVEDQNLIKAPWVCQDPDDQVFLNLAYTARPCVLLSKDNEILKFAKRAIAEQVSICSDYSAITL